MIRIGQYDELTRSAIMSCIGDTCNFVFVSLIIEERSDSLTSRPVVRIRAWLVVEEMALHVVGNVISTSTVEL